MKTRNDTIVLEESSGYSPTVEGVFYTDISGARIFIPMRVLVRLHDGAKNDLERKGVDWEQFCTSLFRKDAA